MINTSLTEKSKQIATRAHEGQTDKSGLPYILHPLHLAEQMADEITTCVALLHDVVEDSDLTFSDLSAQGIPEEVIEALELLTHDDNIPYMDYIRRIKDSVNQTAIAVKLADLRHNSDAARLKVIDEKAKARIEKYKKAMDILS